MEIYLVRHTSVNVPAGYVYGQTDVPLNDTFEEEASEVKRKLDRIQASDGHSREHPFEKVWCSPLTRCVRLAAWCGYPDAIRDDRLKEINFGAWEMKSWDEISEDSRSKAWFADWLHVEIPGGESFTEQYRRVSNFLEEIKQGPYEKVCLFAHGGVLTCARVWAGEYKLEDAFKNIPPYGAVIRLLV